MLSVLPDIVCAVMEAGLKVTAAQPVGAPVALKSMFPLKPFNGAAVTV